MYFCVYAFIYVLIIVYLVYLFIYDLIFYHTPMLFGTLPYINVCMSVSCLSLVSTVQPRLQAQRSHQRHRDHLSAARQGPRSDATWDGCSWAADVWAPVSTIISTARFPISHLEQVGSIGWRAMQPTSLLCYHAILEIRRFSAAKSRHMQKLIIDALFHHWWSRQSWRSAKHTCHTRHIIFQVRHLSVGPGPGSAKPLGKGEDDGSVKLFSAVQRGHAAWTVSAQIEFLWLENSVVQIHSSKEV